MNASGERYRLWFDRAGDDLAVAPTRYPNGIPGSLPDGLPGPDEAQEAIRIAEAIRDFVRDKLTS